jgi:chemotaxis response regulator CheB
MTSASYGADVIGVVLTGNLDNGTAGLLAIKDCGGITVVAGSERGFGAVDAAKRTSACGDRTLLAS